MRHANLGNLIRLAPLSMGELPSHPELPASSGSPEEHVLYQPRCQVLYPTPDQSPDQPPNQPRETLEGVPGGPNFIIPKMTAEGEPETITIYEPTVSGRFDDHGRPLLESFVFGVLDEANIFMNDIMPQRFKPTSQKPSPPADAKVDVFKYEIFPQTLEEIHWRSLYLPRNPPADLGKSGEAWFARASKHPDKPQKGTASFVEFESGLRDNHSEHEAEYTPSVFDARLVLDWNILQPPAENAPDFHGFKNVSMRIFEMGHKLPPPLSTRVFPVLVITADLDSYYPDFIVVQIPVNLEQFPKAFYSNGRNLTEGDDSLKRKKPILGAYTSIERCKSKNGHIEWTMATASDAKGWLPMWAQKMGVPGAIVKDVGLFLKWTEQKRSRTSS